MQQGKVENLRVAARRLDGTLLTPGAVFGFWKQLGRPARRRGFVSGRMLQQGCIVPAAGGGLCQLSNALYDVALNAGCEIIERHAHSRKIPGSAAETGRDATVAWNYVDLRFRSPQPLLLRVRLTADELFVELRAKTGVEGHAYRDTSRREVEGFGETCATCNEVSCFRHERSSRRSEDRTAFLVNEAWPEFSQFIVGRARSRAALFIPVDGRRFGLKRYDWETRGFTTVVTATTTTLRNSLAMRRMAEQGAARRAAELNSAERLAREFARNLKPDVMEVCVAQSLLPWLWRDGHLGGRRFRVLMTALPIHELQRRLDSAALLRPESGTLSDFRAPSDLAELECDALAAAEQLITPHAEIAKLFGDRAVKLAWRNPPPAAPASMPCAARRIAFAGPTAARKGCYEVRDAARALDLDVVLSGSELEGDDFWHGIRTTRVESPDWLHAVAAVVQPAIVEQAPRRLLQALAAGVPVIATEACGLDPRPGLTIIPACDSEALIAALRAQLG
ncbi:MAG: VanW family protein [Rhizomicrobium sp.]|jgi:hypothetical protein